MQVSTSWHSSSQMGFEPSTTQLAPSAARCAHVAASRKIWLDPHGGVAPADVDRLGYSNVYEARLDTAGTVYSACQVGAHCTSGQKIAVAVA